MLNICNSEKHSLSILSCNNFIEMVYIYFSIVIVLEEFPDFKEAFEQEYEVRLNSQQIEKIFLKDDEITTLKLKSMEDLSLKDALQLLLNHLKEWLDSIGYNIE